MKKTISLVLALLSVLGGVLFVMISRPSPEPGVFLPPLEDGYVQVHIRRADHAMEWIVNLDKFVRSSDLPPSGLEELMPFVGRGAFQAEVPPVGSSDRFFMALEIIEVPKAIEISRAIREEAIRRGWESASLNMSLPQEIAPLFVLSRGDLRSYWGLWRRGAGSVILVASSPQDLSSMAPIWDLPVRHTSGPDWGRLEMPDFSSELSLSRTEERILLSSWADTHDPSMSRDMPNVGEIPLYGGGDLAVLAAFTELSSSLSEGIMGSLLSEDVRFFMDSAASIARSLGLTEGDLLNLTDGRVSFVLGSSASGLMGAMPGGYVLLEGVSPDLGSRIVDGVSRLNLPFGAGSLKKVGWQGGLFFKLPLSVVLAYGDRGFLAGIVDPDELNRRPAVPDRIADSIDKARHAAFSVDVRGLLSVLETYRSMASFLDEDLASILGSSMEVLSPWDRLELYAPSVGCFELSLYRLRD